jgi:hypothetical protein
MADARVLLRLRRIVVHPDEHEERKGAANSREDDLPTEEVQIEDVDVQAERQDRAVARRAHVLELVLGGHLVHCAQASGENQSAAADGVGRQNVGAQPRRSHTGRRPANFPAANENPARAEEARGYAARTHLTAPRSDRAVCGHHRPCCCCCVRVCAVCCKGQRPRTYAERRRSPADRARPWCRSP